MAEYRKGYMRKSLIPLICALSTLAFLLAACGGENSNTKGGNSSQTFSPSEGDGANDSPSRHGPTFENGVLTTPDVKIKITRYKIIKAGQKDNEYGKKTVITFWYRTTNLSGGEMDPYTAWLNQFDAMQDTSPNPDHALGVGFPPEEFLGAEDVNIKNGGTVESAFSYKLDDLQTPVVLVAQDNGDEVGKATYKLR